MGIRKIVSKHTGRPTYQISYFLHGKRKRKNYKTKKEAENNLAKIRTAIAEGRATSIGIANRKTTLQELADSFIEDARQKNRPHWFRNKSAYVRRFVDSVGPTTLAAAVSFGDISKFRDDLSREPINKAGGVRTPAPMNRIMVTIRGMFDHGVVRSMLVESPFARVPSKEVYRQEAVPTDHFFSKEDIERLLKAAEYAPWVRRMITMGVCTGADFGDLANLSWSQIHDDKLFFRRGKTARRMRDRVVTIPLNEDIRAVLDEIRRAPFRHAELVLTHNGQKIQYVPFYKEYRNILKKAGLEGNFKTLRHTFGSHLAMSGASIRTIQKLMGHASIVMTQRYSHLTPIQLENAMRSIEGLTKTEVPRKWHEWETDTTHQAEIIGLSR